jgi:hypothetical protein
MVQSARIKSTAKEFFAGQNTLEVSTLELAVIQITGNDLVEMRRILFAFRCLAFFLQSPLYLRMRWDASDWRACSASRGFHLIPMQVLGNFCNV